MLLFKDFFPPDVMAFVSDRSVDFSLNDSSFTPEQKEYLSEHLNFDGEGVFNIKQVHGHDIVTAEKGAGDASFVQADGATTKTPDFPLAVRTADCLPIFIFDPSHKTISLVHAGWRGSRERVAAQALKVMHEKWGSHTEDLKVAFGPAICAKHYQVGAEFKDYFTNDVIDRSGTYYLDLSSINKKQLLALGVKEDNIYDCGVCTFEEEKCFSYRREGEQAGRMISLFMLR